MLSPPETKGATIYAWAKLLQLWAVRKLFAGVGCAEVAAAAGRAGVVEAVGCGVVGGIAAEMIYVKGGHEVGHDWLSPPEKNLL